MFMNKKDKAADARFKREFYIGDFVFGLAQYNQLLAFQKGACAICKKKFPSRLALDHDHVSGLLRGLLCFRCNRGYGLFHDNDILRLQAAVGYLTSPPCVRLFGGLCTAPGRLGTKKRARLLKKMRGNKHETK